MFSLKDKSVLLTGGGSGIGLAIAVGLKKAGAKVGIFEKNITTDIPSNIKSYSVDLSEHEKLEEYFNGFISEFDSIDVLVNNAGITISNPSEDYLIPDWQATIDVNLSSTFVISQLAGRRMILQGLGGSIINVTSIGSAQGFPNNPAYCASKGGIRQLTKSLAYDWGEYGIRVNNLVPGYTNTPMNKKSWNDQELRKKRSDHTMLKKWAEPEDMIGPAIFLASDASKYVTGSDLYVDGGWNAKGI
tara:strand:+ start:599 stop:1333 length:735 start_codon:yes stop_codon:yes gene_type:complete